MIGDTGAGTCFSYRGILTGDLAHPTLTCSRLNISENNSAVPVDRFYYSYRHFRNSTNNRLFQFAESFDVDRHTLGLEKTFWDGRGSLELRVPIEYRLNSNFISIVAPSRGPVDLIIADPERQGELANISLLLKGMLRETERSVISAGMGITLPTADDVTYGLGVDDTILFPTPGLTGDTLAFFNNVFENKTVYLSPFLSWLHSNGSRWFHQGFMQVEVAANPSRLRVGAGDGGVTDLFLNGNPIGFSVFRIPPGTNVNIFAQTLMRLNMGLGYRVIENPCGRWLKNLTAQLELHYTTTLHDAILSSVPLETLPGSVLVQTIEAGNADRRTDILNLATGFTAQIGKTVITNGIAVPLRDQPDRGFDFEYNLHVQRNF